MRLTISIYGYLKRMAAVSCVKHEQEMMTEEEAFQLLESCTLCSIPLELKADVQAHKEAIELGNGEQGRGPQTGFTVMDACVACGSNLLPLSQFQGLSGRWCLPNSDGMGWRRVGTVLSINRD